MRQRLRLAEVCLDQHVLARRFEAEVEQLERGGKLAHYVRAVPAEDRCDEEKELVDQAGGEKRRR
jgi:hypothetical protein